MFCRGMISRRCLSGSCYLSENVSSNLQAFIAAVPLNHTSGCAHSPELHDTGDIAWRIEASDVIEVANVQAAINAPCKSNRSQQFVSLRLPITARTGDASASAITHYGADNGRKLGEEDILTISLIQNPWDTREWEKKINIYFFIL